MSRNLTEKLCDTCGKLKPIGEFRKYGRASARKGYSYSPTCNACAESQNGFHKCRRCGGKFAIEDYPLRANGRRSGTCIYCWGLPEGQRRRRPEAMPAQRGPQPMGIPPECSELERYNLAWPYWAVRVVE